MELTKELYHLAEDLNQDTSNFPTIEIKKNCMDQVAPFLQAHHLATVVLVVDKHTYQVAGEKLQNALQDKVTTHLVSLRANAHGQVNADETTIMQLLVGIPEQADALIAVGAGTIHDITRFCAYKMGIPFISVPTAASVDGFTSKGAPLILEGVKQTIQTASPIAVFADIAVLKDAPKELTAAGFGDILGKYTSLLDWKISYLIGEEPYNQTAADLTRTSLDTCIQYVEEIAQANEEGVAILMQALIESGLVMLLINSSRSASGGEHHLSHFWEMELLKKDAKQLLHGAKVGVTTILIADLYRQFAHCFATDLLKPATKIEERLITYWPTIKTEILTMPDSDWLRTMLNRVGGPTTSRELGIDDQLVEESLNKAYYLRDRCTGLLLINKLKKQRIAYPFEKVYG
ncbi:MULTISPECIES: sn-glycerol-1-phosphate dehydrogenase [Virgibacillus]|uniref:Glycerol-1-phosphate dehydrogenase [NAD(P)+] n=2 Tax=Virgibacillus TaxID=84406 RepID=A0A024Q833_9BACI|nr:MULTISPECIES: sn-glycerol-1-phosphate dehydrogenase [Virgibacillus]EQB38066.1 hypothetical protein M948_05705 [Virgibacillus sp. CM-4]MYL40783.1 iron-containing alcohol dehydrogenase [Virgibacillus massiliensis]GGJ51798.1 glycerol-1-phosphate dehydrogenase [NAD(P)+] [Virgibacillus kapii]CDQ38422.1 Glycerol-1-phosphate dehydrogenase [NAD(P)+] [Virgibacillus massiliensis]